MSASVALPLLEEILQLTDINAIQRLLQVPADKSMHASPEAQDAVTLESQLTAQLDVLLTKTESIDAKLDFIDIVPYVACVLSHGSSALTDPNSSRLPKKRATCT